MEEVYAIGIDIGGTKIRTALINEQGDLKNKMTCSTPVLGGKVAILEKLVDIINQYQSSCGSIKGVGIGTAGRVCLQTGDIIYATDNLPGWTGVPLKKVLEDRCHLRVDVQNDVNAAALGEGWMGNASDMDDFALISIGTGIGGALIQGGRIINGPTGSAGEIGHMILYPGGRRCNCGQQGCLEQYVSGTCLYKYAKEIDEHWDSYHLIEELAAGNKRAIQQIERFTYDFAISLVNLHHFFDPELVIIGGGVGSTFSLWRWILDEQLKSLTPQPIKIADAYFGEDAAILGAVKSIFKS